MLSSHFRFNLRLAMGLCVVCCIGFQSLSLADIVHFANGNKVRGKLDRVTGDIIEFRRSNHFFGDLDYCKRIQLTDRHDVVETTDGKRYFGEIIYLDGFILEIQTTTGAVRLKRMELSSVVMGSPSQSPNVPKMKTVSPQEAGLPPEPPGEIEQPAVRTIPMTTISNSGNRRYSTRKPKASTVDDEDAIPAVDR